MTCEPYDKSACAVELKGLTQCLMLDSETVLVSPQGGSQNEAEDILLLLKKALQQRQATQDCQDAAIPFACQFLFPPCSPSGQEYLPSQEHCLNVSTDVCTGTWQALQAARAPLPDCSTLPPAGVSGSPCTGTELKECSPLCPIILPVNMSHIL